MNTRRGGRDSSMAGEQCQAAFSFTCAYLGLEKFPFLWQRERNIRELFLSRTSTLLGEGRGFLSYIKRKPRQMPLQLLPSSKKGHFLETGACMLELRYAKGACGLARAERFQPAERPLFCWANLAGFWATVADHSDLNGLSH